MKIKRFSASSMREAIRLVREEQGPDAVILSNRRVDNGVEVVAAIDYDESLVRQALRAMPGGSAQEPQATPATPQPLPHDPAVIQMQSELTGMRRWLESRLTTLSSMQLQASPARAAAMRELDGLGVLPGVAREIAAEVPDRADGEQARRLPLGLLAKRLPIETRDILADGGIVALIGPTGVGKTTTIAKLAARFAARHGIRDVALITTDNYRIGAREQLYTYGRLLGVPVFLVNNADELTKTLVQLSGCKLVLVDTAGMSQRDRGLGAQLAMLRSGARSVRNYLVLAANAQAADLDEVVGRFGVAQPAGCILTKIDETTRLGGALSVLVRHRLPLTYVCDGQRVPEDIHLAKAHQLVLGAVRLAQRHKGDVDVAESLLPSTMPTTAGAHAASCV